MANGRRIVFDEAKRIGDSLGVDWNMFPIEQFRMELVMEAEHGGANRHRPVVGAGLHGPAAPCTQFMAIRSPQDIARGKTIAIVWTILAYSGAVLTGLAGIALIHHGNIAESLLAGTMGQIDAERILPVLAAYLFPAWFAGILISGAVAAMMSTADSQLLVTTSAIVEDVYAKALGRNLSPARMVTLSR